MTPDATPERIVYNGNSGAPDEPEANSAFHQEILDRMFADVAADFGWKGAKFHHYYRENGMVCIGLVEGEAWPGLEELRAAMPEIRYRPEPEADLQQGSLGL